MKQLYKIDTNSWQSLNDQALRDVVLTYQLLWKSVSLQTLERARPLFAFVRSRERKGKNRGTLLLKFSRMWGITTALGSKSQIRRGRENWSGAVLIRDGWRAPWELARAPALSGHWRFVRHHDIAGPPRFEFHTAIHYVGFFIFVCTRMAWIPRVSIFF